LNGGNKPTRYEAAEAVAPQINIVAVIEKEMPARISPLPISPNLHTMVPI
jgi:hypothetical protein